LYERYHSRLIMYYSGLTIVMPIFIIFFLFFTMANIAFPGTSSFIGEFLILSGVFKFNFFSGILGGLGIILGGAYFLCVFNRFSYCNLKLWFLSSYADLNLREFYILFLFFLCTLIIGIFPNLVLDVIHPWVFSLYSFFI